MDKMISSLGKTWNGKDFDFGKASGFYSGMDSMVNTVTKNAKIVEGATGSYDAFFNYFKDKKIYVSDELKKAMGGDTYKELLQNNIGKIVRDASKGISIDSLWGEMRDLFPEHFSDNITNQVDQIVHAFDVLHQARADVGQVTTAQNMTAEQLTGISDSAAEQVVEIADRLRESLQKSITGYSEAAKTTIDLDVNVNTDKISSDIRSAVENAGNQAEGALKVDMEVNEEQLVSKIREAINSLTSGDEPVKVNLQVNKESLQEDLNLALTDMDLPVHFKIDTEEIESQIRAAIESIQDIELDLRVNTNNIREDVDTAVNGATETPEVRVPEVDNSGLSQMQQVLQDVNAAGVRGQSVFQSLGGTFREAFSAYSLANMMQDGIYKIVDAGKEAVSTVKEFDDLKTNLAMVTGKDKTYTEDLMQSYNKLGQEIGSITSDVAESANTWLRQGRSMADTNQLIKDSMVLSKDAQMSSEDAAQVLTSTLNGFKLGADQASRITASAKGIVKITQAADSITLKGLKAGKTVIKVQGAGGYCKTVSLNVSVLKDATKNSKIVNSTAKNKKYSLTTEEKNRVLNMSTGQNANTVKANTKKEAELKKWYGALPTYTGGDAEIEKIKDPIVKHFAKKGKKASNANIIKAASILGYKDAKNVSKWDTKKKNAMVKKLQTFGFSKGGVIRNLIPATMGTLLGDAIMKNGDTGFIGAKPGETVLTQDFTKLLKPTTATMQEFTEVMQKAGTPSVKETPVRQEVTMNNDYQFVINGVDVNDMSELKKVIRGELDKHDKELAKEFKKFR